MRLDQPNPELALGNILGANMLNMLTFAVVAMIFGGRRFLQKVAPEQGYLITLAIILTALAVMFSVFKPDISFLEPGAILDHIAGGLCGGHADSLCQAASG